MEDIDDDDEEDSEEAQSAEDNVECKAVAAAEEVEVVDGHQTALSSTTSMG